jgi:hypothetical protein
MTAKTPRNVLTTYADPSLGVVVTVYKARKAPKMTMNGKTTRGASTGTGGFSTSFPRKATFTK